jgi:hypothetical protein
MTRRKFITTVGATGVGSLISACGGGSESTTTELPTLGMAIPDPLEVAGRLPAYNKDYSGGAALPKSVNNAAACPPVGNQGNLGSCTAWATAYGLASYVNGKTNSISPTAANNQASPSDMYAKLLSEAGSNCGSGTVIQRAMNILVKRGVGSNAALPYSASTCATPSSASTFRIKSFQAIKASDSIMLKRELASGKVLAFGARVTEDIYSIKSNTYFATGANIGGHAMLLVGYDDNRNAWRVMNSWGPNWGDGGFFWFDYSAFTAITVEACSPFFDTGPVRPTSTAPATIVTSATAGSSIYDSVYKEEYLYIYVEFTNIWFVQSYKIYGGVNQTVLLESKTGVDQWMEGSYFITKKAGNIGAFPVGTYRIELTGVGANNANLTLSTNLIVLSFVAKDPAVTTQ